MQNKLKRLLIDLLPIVFWCIAIVLLIAFAYKNGSLQLWQVLLLTLAGLIINYFLSLFFHELGHLAFAKKNKAKTASVNFGLFTVDKKQKRVKLFTVFGENAGSSEFVTVDKISAERVRSIAFGGLLFHLVYVLGVFLVILLVKNTILFSLFGIGGLSACYLLTVNLLPFDKSADGAVVLRTEYAEAVAQISNLELAVKRDENIQLNDFLNASNQPLAKYCKYFILSLQDSKVAIDFLNIDQNTDLTDQEYGLLFPEMLFKACINGEVGEKLKNRAENYFSAQSLSICDLRAHYAFRLFTGESEWAKSILLTYNQELQNLPNKQKQSENNLFSLIEK